MWKLRKTKMMGNEAGLAILTATVSRITEENINIVSVQVTFLQDFLGKGS